MRLLGLVALIAAYITAVMARNKEGKVVDGELIVTMLRCQKAHHLIPLEGI